MKSLFTFIILCFASLSLQSQETCSIGQFSYDLVREDGTHFYIKISKPLNISEKYTVTILDEEYPEPSFMEEGKSFYGPFPADCETFYSIYVENKANENCNIKVNFGSVCALNEDCGFVDIRHEIIECNDEHVLVLLDFEPINTNNLGFDLFAGNGEFLGFFKYADLPVKVKYPHIDAAEVKFEIFDNDNEQCKATYPFFIDCNPSDLCKIYNLSYSYPECNPNGVTEVTLEFEYQNVSDSFYVKGNGNFYGRYAYADVPVTIAPVIPQCDKELEFIIQDIENDQCKLVADGIYICCPEPCEEPGFKIVNIECDSSDVFIKVELFRLEPVFPVQVAINGEIIDSYEYDYPYIYIKTNNTFAAIVNSLDICTVQFEGFECCSSEEFTLENCLPSDECKIYNITYTYPECDDNPLVPILLDFDYINITSDSFIVKGNGSNYGTFAYSDLPVEIGILEADCSILYEFEISDKANPDCSNYIEEVRICCSTECNDPTFEIVNVECEGDHLFMKLKINSDPIVNGVKVFINQEQIADFEYSFPYIYIWHEGPFAAVNNNIVVCTSSGNTECCHSEVFAIDGCEPNSNCEIGEINIKTVECTDDNIAVFVLDFEYANVGNEGFKVKGNGINYGSFSYEDLPISIETENNCDDLFYEFVVLDNEKEDCFNYIDYGPYCCDVNDCSFEIEDLRVKCEDGIINEVAFYLFEATDPIKTYNVYINDVLIGETSDNNIFLEFPTEIEIIPGEGYVLRICDEECCIERKLDLSECSVNECQIGEIIVEELSCGDEGIEFILDFKHEGTNSEKFNIYSLFGYFGTYKYADLPLKIENFPVFGAGSNILFICDEGSFCCNAYVIEGVQCSPFINVTGDIDYPDQVEDVIFIKQNPANRNLYLQSPFENTEYRLYNSAGQLVREIQAESLETISDISNLTAGIYVVQIKTPTGFHTEKLIISKFR